MEQKKDIIIDANWQEYVDLGLPSGNLWAVCNVGAKNPQDKGRYYMWGDTKGFPIDQTTYLSPEQYNVEIAHKDIVNSFGDLKSEYDVVHLQMGGSWCLPSIEDFMELNSLPKTFLHGIECVQIQSIKNNKSLLFPMAGFADFSQLYQGGANSYFWCHHRKSPTDVNTINLSSSCQLNNACFQGHYGHSVRGVLHAKGKHIIRKGYIKSVSAI